MEGAVSRQIRCDSATGSSDGNRRVDTPVTYAPATTVLNAGLDCISRPPNLRNSHISDLAEQREGPMHVAPLGARMTQAARGEMRQEAPAPEDYSDNEESSKIKSSNIE